MRLAAAAPSKYGNRDCVALQSACHSVLSEAERMQRRCERRRREHQHSITCKHSWQNAACSQRANYHCDTYGRNGQHEARQCQSRLLHNEHGSVELKCKIGDLGAAKEAPHADTARLFRSRGCPVAHTLSVAGFRMSGRCKCKRVLARWR